MEDIIRSEEDLLGVGVQTYTSLSVILDYYMKIKMHGEGFAQWYKADDSTKINTNGYMSPVRVLLVRFKKYKFALLFLIRSLGPVLSTAQGDKKDVHGVQSRVSVSVGRSILSGCLFRTKGWNEKQSRRRSNMRV